MNNTYFKLEVNGILLPEIYFNYEHAKQALQDIRDKNICVIGRVITY